MSNNEVFSIKRAEEEILQRVETLNKKWYPSYHLAGQAGWINDPNGLIYVDGWYHAFYQHHPYGTAWGPMHWGHARSRNLIDWEQLPIALAPDHSSDIHGCFSGSALLLDDGRMALFYTGNVFKGEEHTDDNLYQVQCVAVSTDREHTVFEKLGEIIPTPENCHHFRDPKVWKEDNGKLYMVVGLQRDGKGEISLYSTPQNDLFGWEYEGPLLVAEDIAEGFMWECPDFFQIEDKWVLLFSPQGVSRDGYKNVNLYQSGYIIGTWEPGSEFTPETDFIEIDKGDSFYAPQTFVDENNSRVMIGWMVMWESFLPESNDGWAGQLTLPRTLSLNDDKNRIIQSPVMGIVDKLTHSLDAVINLDNKTLSHPSMFSKPGYLRLNIDIKKSTFETAGLSFGKGAKLYVDSQAGRLVFEREYIDYGIVTRRSVPINYKENKLNVHIFFDKSSIEIFLGDSEEVLSSRIYPEADDSLVSFSWGGKAFMEIDLWKFEV